MNAPVPHPVTLPSFGEKVARLRERYLQQLPERIAQVQALVQQLCALPHPPLLPTHRRWSCTGCCTTSRAPAIRLA